MEKKRHNEERLFGIVFSLIFFGIAFYNYYYYSIINSILIVIGIALFFISIIAPVILKPLNFLWIKFGILLSRITSPIILGFIYFVLMFGTKLYLGLFRKKLIIFKPEKNIDTYWINKEDKVPDLTKQF